MRKQQNNNNRHLKTLNNLINNIESNTPHTHTYMINMPFINILCTENNYETISSFSRFAKYIYAWIV